MTTKRAYFCSPLLNKSCSKEGCCINGGDCFLTTKVRFAVKAPVRAGMWVNGFSTFCGEEAITEWNETGGEHVYTNFCPNCGAHMDREVLKAWKRIRALSTI